MSSLESSFSSASFAIRLDLTSIHDKFTLTKWLISLLIFLIPTCDDTEPIVKMKSFFLSSCSSKSTKPSSNESQNATILQPQNKPAPLFPKPSWDFPSSKSPRDLLSSSCSNSSKISSPSAAYVCPLPPTLDPSSNSSVSFPNLPPKTF